jgi:hypothetical protein
MFFKLGLNKEKSLLILPLCRGQTVVTRTRERSGNSRIFKISGALIVIMSFCRILFQKSGTKSRGVFTFCTATVILHCTFYPALLPKCGILWNSARLHNVDNIRQKDIKFFMSRPVGFIIYYLVIIIIIIIFIFLQQQKHVYDVVMRCCDTSNTNVNWTELCCV